LHNLPARCDLWPGAARHPNAGSVEMRHFDFVRDQRISGHATSPATSVVLGRIPSVAPLPPSACRRRVHHGSISAQGLAECRTDRQQDDGAPLYVDDRVDGTMRFANTTVLHGVAARPQRTGDLQQARAARNPAVSPHLKFGDFGGHGYATSQ
jgi:hypothetical protein